MGSPRSISCLARSKTWRDCSGLSLFPVEGIQDFLNHAVRDFSREVGNGEGFSVIGGAHSITISLLIISVPFELSNHIRIVSLSIPGRSVN